MRRERGVQPDEIRQMVRCVQLYYRAQRHQNEIARELGLSSSKVSRLLKRAFAEGLVRVEIELPKRPRLEAALVERFRLRDAVVIPLGETRDLRRTWGRPPRATSRRSRLTAPVSASRAGTRSIRSSARSGSGGSVIWRSTRCPARAPSSWWTCSRTRWWA